MPIEVDLAERQNVSSEGYSLRTPGFLFLVVRAPPDSDQLFKCLFFSFQRGWAPDSLEQCLTVSSSLTLNVGQMELSAWSNFFL